MREQVEKARKRLERQSKLQEAVAEGDYKKLKAILKNKWAREQINSLLFVAANSKSSTMLDFLVSYGADPLANCLIGIQGSVVKGNEQALEVCLKKLKYAWKEIREYAANTNHRHMLDKVRAVLEED